MAKSKQGTGKTAKRASASRSSGGKSRASQNRSGARASGSASRKTSSGRAQRRAQASNLGSSVALAGVGLLVIALVLVRGEGGWLMLRNVLFGIFGIVTYLVGPFLLYLAYLVASGYRVSIFVAKMTLLTLMAASVPVVFSRFAVHESTAWDIIKMLYSWGQTRFWAGGVFGGIGAVLLALCGRPGANIIMLLLFLVGQFAVLGSFIFLLASYSQDAISVMVAGGILLVLLGIWVIIDGVLALCGRFRDRNGRRITQWQ